MKLLLFLLPLINAATIEQNLRRNLLQNYDKYLIPVKNNSHPITLNYGIEILGLNYFNQKAENIEMNVYVKQQWKDEYLVWNYSDYNINNIYLNSDDIWKPDLELYNSGKKPFLFSDKNRVKVEKNGLITWTVLKSYKFSCMLELEQFPFDRQKCNLLFGSWKFSKTQLDIKPFSNKTFRNISVSPDFSHNEWSVFNTYVDHKEIEYLCCPGELYPNTYFYIEFERNSHKYQIVLIFSILLTLSAFAVSCIHVSNYRRAFILVFLPLTIIWLQIYIADKIPIIEYPTLMERLFINSFITTMLISFESTILYCLYTGNYIGKKQPSYKNINTHAVKTQYKASKVIYRGNVTKINRIIDIFDNFFRVLLFLSYIISILVLILS